MSRRMWSLAHEKYPDARDVPGGIATAVSNNVCVVIVRCDDYMHPDEAYLNSLEMVGSEEEIHTLASFGLSLPRSKDAYRQL